jgi:hypothetical protein
MPLGMTLARTHALFETHSLVINGLKIGHLKPCPYLFIYLFIPYQSIKKYQGQGF